MKPWTAIGVAAGFIAAALLSGCRTTSCLVGQTRCFGHVVQYCDSSHVWSTYWDCSTISQLSGKEFVCREPEGQVLGCHLPEYDGSLEH